MAEMTSEQETRFINRMRVITDEFLAVAARGEGENPYEFLEAHSGALFVEINAEGIDALVVWNGLVDKSGMAARIEGLAP